MMIVDVPDAEHRSAGAAFGLASATPGCTLARSRRA
jgi:hypothetical protein